MLADQPSWRNLRTRAADQPAGEPPKLEPPTAEAPARRGDDPAAPEAISSPAPAAGPAAAKAQAGGRPRLDGDALITIADIRQIFRLGRTAAYELTRRPGFPDPVQVSARCYRWWASEVDAFAAALPREHARQAPRPGRGPRLPGPATPPRQITGTVRAARARTKDPS